MNHQVLREPRWPAFVAMLAAAGVYLALPEPLTLGPSWLLLAIIVLLLIPIVISARRGNYRITRILTFVATGGPLLRELPNGMSKSSFLFPQMIGRENRDSSWVPNFVDYLFLAFNTSTAFSPTDTAVMSRWAKLGTMLQSLISLTIIALLAARAVNIL